MASAWSASLNGGLGAEPPAAGPETAPGEGSRGKLKVFHLFSYSKGANS